MSTRGIINTIFADSIEAEQNFAQDENNILLIEEAAEAIIHAYRQDKKVLIFGNGGSAADSQHMATELVARFEKERRALSAIALTTNSSSLTAISNDYDYDKIFARQMEAFARKGDIAVAISTSGTSANVMQGVKIAKLKGVKVIGLIGRDGGTLVEEADIPIVVRVDNTARVQEIHITIIHIICKLVEDALGKKK